MPRVSRSILSPVTTLLLEQGSLDGQKSAAW